MRLQGIRSEGEKGAPRKCRRCSYGLRIIRARTQRSQVEQKTGGNSPSCSLGSLCFPGRTTGLCVSHDGDFFPECVSDAPVIDPSSTSALNIASSPSSYIQSTTHAANAVPRVYFLSPRRCSCLLFLNPCFAALFQFCLPDSGFVTSSTCADLLE